ncbi:MAG: hypothetical protein HY826_00995 [Actinobacteria bacterium]|nr:hypothetical protein [Actinomycetota bacterium]
MPAHVHETPGVASHNVPVAKLVPFRPVATRRVLGGWQGQVVIPDDFNELPAEVAAAFAGERT